MEGVRKEIGQECMTCGSCVHGWNDLQDWCIISNLLSFPAACPSIVHRGITAFDAWSNRRSRAREISTETYSYD